MARARNIKPGLFVNDDLADLHPLTRLLFIGLWTIADREGRLIDNPRKIAVQVLPYDDHDVNQALDSLQERGFIQRYVVDNNPYIQIVNFAKHQNPHKNEAPSSIPAPEQHRTSTVQEPEQHTTNPADSLNPITDSFQEQAAQPKTTAPRKRGCRLPENWEPSEETKAWAMTERKDLDIQRVLDSFTDYWRAKTGSAATKLDWDATFRNWVRNEKSSGTGRNRTGETAVQRSERLEREAFAKHGITY